MREIQHIVLEMESFLNFIAYAYVFIGLPIISFSVMFTSKNLIYGHKYNPKMKLFVVLRRQMHRLHSPLLIVGGGFFLKLCGFGVILIACPSFSIVESEISLSQLLKTIGFPVMKTYFRILGQHFLHLYQLNGKIGRYFII